MSDDPQKDDEKKKPVERKYHPQRSTDPEAVREAADKQAEDAKWTHPEST